MALSMDEQRMLAEIARRLVAEDPGLAARLSSFRRPGPAARLRSTRAKIIGSLLTVALVAVISLTVYAMIPFRAHSPQTTTTQQASNPPGISAPARVGPSSGTAASGTAASGTAKSGTAAKVRTTTKPVTANTATANTASHPSAAGAS